MKSQAVSWQLKGLVLAAIAVVAACLIIGMIPASAYAAPYNGTQKQVQLKEKDSDGDWVPAYQKDAAGNVIYNDKGNPTAVLGTATVSSGTIQLIALDERGIAQNKRVITIFTKNYNPAVNDERWNEYLQKNGSFYDSTDIRAIQKAKGIKYNAKKNTLTIKNAKYAKYRLVARGMGANFKIKVSGTKNQFASIDTSAIAQENYVQYDAYYDGEPKYLDQYAGITPTCLSITGKGKVAINKKKLSGDAISMNGAISDDFGLYYDAAKEEVISQDISRGSKTTLKVAKSVKLALYAYGINDAINVYGTTIKKANKAISIKGTYKEKLVKKSVKNVPAHNSLNSAKDQYVVKCTDGFFYTWDAYDASDTLVRDYTYDGNTDFYSFNSGTAWGKVADHSPSYFDKATREYYDSQWEMYSLDASGKFNFIATVGNDQNLPKGYTVDRDEGYVTPIDEPNYSYVVSNTKVV